ncbi:unnamed protein product [Rhizophagus irregularis]|uniref:Uncharacterized protein n=1 Tax=Rhizophagus irregularis TaxID=588596 RepID=A0A2N1MXI0_9GLOM|nr:hypothetical protein RhiirC2_784910 [Rhizophagus irregularis]CAB4395068.1 unnamed protein product [Rhizophagus irregularis]
MIDHKQQPTNLTQMKHTSLNGLFTDQKDNATSNYKEPSDSFSIGNRGNRFTASRIVHRRRNQRKLRREIKYPLNHYMKRLPIQITNDPFTIQLFNGSPF